MRCSKCGFENPEGMKFCGQCINPLALICPKCHFENPVAAENPKSEETGSMARAHHSGASVTVLSAEAPDHG